MTTAVIDTRFGRLTLVAGDGEIVRLFWGGETAGIPDTAPLPEAAAQIGAYCDGTREVFDVPLRMDGSDLQRAVWEQIAAIPFGETRSYGEIAAAIGAPAQAVGQACGANPIPIIVPCHRVLGAGGKMTGFSGGDGVETKVALLRHEGAGGLLI